MNAQPDERFNEEETGAVAEPPVVDQQNDTAEVLGTEVPQPMSAQNHVNQPLIEPEPYPVPSDEQVAATTEDVSTQLPDVPAESSTSTDSGIPDYSPEANPEQLNSPVEAPPAYGDETAVNAPVMAPVAAATTPTVQQPYYTQQYPAQPGGQYPGQQGAQHPYNTAQHSPYYQNEPYVELVLAPEVRSNRAFSLSFAGLGILMYAGLLLGALILLGIFSFVLTGGLGNLVELMLYPNYYLSVAGFAVVYLLIALFSNRAGWWLYVVSGYLTAAGALAGFLLGRFWEESIWVGQATIQDVVFNNLFAPTAVIVLSLAREVPIWVGAIVAARGKKLKAQYETEQAEYQKEINGSAPGAEIQQP